MISLFLIFKIKTNLYRKQIGENPLLAKKNHV